MAMLFLCIDLGGVAISVYGVKAEIGRWLAGCDSVNREVNITEIIGDNHLCHCLPFCRGPILQLIVAKFKTSCETEVESSPTKPLALQSQEDLENQISVKGAAASRVCHPWARLERLLAAVQERLRPKSSEGITHHR
ncbi:hypothetical protein PIB30_036615 [Stylosanthes scabra]|uniref:Uncharacterized protein n=1 Tax=Stylosanthes scabra TaxID=79078 RepID=A0ABU6RE04_9FABA|nr:hypothetical protein [Stylosanthes scabra]